MPCSPGPFHVAQRVQLRWLMGRSWPAQSDPEVRSQRRVGCGWGRSWCSPRPLRSGQSSFRVKSSLLPGCATFVLQTAKQKQQGALKPFHHKNVHIVLVLNLPVCLAVPASAQPLLRESHGFTVFAGGGRGPWGHRVRTQSLIFLNPEALLLSLV